jgi:uncharacterized protein YbjT (DUF2867 family)
MFVVAGATGKTGRVVAEALLSRGETVRVLVRGVAKAEPWKRRGAEVVDAPLNDAAALERVLEGAAGFYALLPEDLTVPDFHGHRRSLAACLARAVKAARVPHVVFLSAAAAVLRDGNGPAADLHAAENALRAVARITTVRSCFFMENVRMALGPALHEGVYPNMLPSPELEIPMIATRDIGRIAARCLLEPPAQSEVIDLVGPLYSARRVAALLGTALGKQLRVVDVPAAAQTAMMIQAGVPEPFARALAELNACMASGRVIPRGDRMLAGTTSLEELLPELLQ